MNFSLSLHPSDLRAWALVLSTANIASITLRVNDVEDGLGDVETSITLKADKVYVDGQLEVMGELIAEKADISDITADKITLRSLDGEHTVTLDYYNLSLNSTLGEHSKSITASFDRIEAAEGEISTLKSTMITTSFLEANNVEMAGAKIYTLQIGDSYRDGAWSFNGMGIKWHRIEVPGVGGYTVLMRT